MSARVRTLYHNDEYVKGGQAPIAPEVWSQVALQRVSDILPNLGSLEWYASNADSLNHALLFISPCLRDLSIRWLPKNSDPTPIMRFIGLISQRGLSLSSFSIRTTVPSRAIEVVLQDLLAHNQALEYVRLPNHFTTPTILTTLASLPALQHLLQTFRSDPFTPPKGDFQQLRTLWFGAPLERANQLLEDKASWPNLNSLGISTSLTRDRHHLHLLMTQVSNFSSQLAALHLNLSDGPSLIQRGIPFDTIRPVLACSQLITFRIRHAYAIILSDENIVEMGRSWPKMKCLSLFEDASEDEMGVRINRLSLFAETFPDLEHLSLLLSTGDCSITRVVTFPKLLSLSVGTSPLTPDNIHTVATQLAQILPLSAVLRGGSEPWDKPLLEGTMAPWGHKEWSEVQKLLDALRQYANQITRNLRTELWETREQLRKAEKQVELLGATD